MMASLDGQYISVSRLYYTDSEKDCKLLTIWAVIVNKKAAEWGVRIATGGWF